MDLLDKAGRTYADEIAVAAAQELRKLAPTPQKMLDASWQDRVDALGRAHYVRYDESTATALGDGATLLLDDYKGDLRTIRGDGLEREPRRFPRLGPDGKTGPEPDHTTHAGSLIARERPSKP